MEKSTLINTKSSKCPKTGQDNCECEKEREIQGRGGPNSIYNSEYFQTLRNINKVNFSNTIKSKEDISHLTSVDTPGYLPLRYQQPM